MSYIFLKSVDSLRHDSFVSHHPLISLLQSSNWSKVKDNWHSCICGVENEKGELVASALILKKKAFLGYSMMYIPRGPILDYENKELVEFYFDHLKKFARQQRVIYIKMDPYILVNDSYLNHEVNQNPSIDIILDHMKDTGAIHLGFPKLMENTIQPRYCAVIPKHEHWYEELSKKTHKELEIANKKKIEVMMGGNEYLESFSDLMKKTQERKGVSLRHSSYFQKILEVYGDDAKLFMAHVNLKDLYEETLLKFQSNGLELKQCPINAKKKLFSLNETNASIIRELNEIEEERKTMGDSVVVCGVLFVKFGDTCDILYAGMDTTFKRYMAPIKTWYTAAKYGFDQGCIRCDLGGVEGTLNDGLTHFKSGLHPLMKEFIGEFDLPVYKYMYKGASIAFQIYKRIKYKERRINNGEDHKG